MRLTNSKILKRSRFDCQKLLSANYCVNPAQASAFNPDANLFIEKFQEVPQEYGWLWHSFGRNVNPFAYAALTDSITESLVPRSDVAMTGWDAFMMRKIFDLMGLTKRSRINGLEYGYNSMLERLSSLTSSINNRDRDSNLINMCSPLLHTYIHNWFDMCDKSGISWNIGTQSPTMTPLFHQHIVGGALFVHTEDDLEDENHNTKMVMVRRNIYSTLNTSKIIAEKGTLKLMNEVMQDLDRGFFRIGVVLWVSISQFNERFVMTKDNGDVIFDSSAVSDDGIPYPTGEGKLPSSIVMPNRKVWKMHTTVTLNPEKLEDFSWRIVDMNSLVGNHVATVNRTVNETSLSVPYFEAATKYATNANTWHELV